MFAIGLSSSGIAQDDASVEVVSEEVMTGYAGLDTSKNLFATDDKTLRKGLLASKKDIARGIRATAPDAFRNWTSALLASLSRNDLDAASHEMAQRFGLPDGPVRQLLRSWALVWTHKYEFFGDEPADVRNRARLIAGINKALDQADHDPLLVQFAAFTLDEANVCDNSLLTLPGTGADRPETLRSIAAITGCSGPLLETIRTDPMHRVADLALLDSLLQKQTALTLWLLRPEIKQHLAQPDQRMFTLALTRDAIADAFARGSNARGLALYDALDPAGRRAMQDDTQAGFTAMIDGIPVIFVPASDVSLTTSLAAALYLADRKDEARVLIDADPKLPVQRRLVDCLFAAQTAKDASKAAEGCGESGNVHGRDPDIDDLILSWAINGQQSDPYPMLETGFSTSGSNANAPLASLYCRLFDVNVAGSVCADAKRSVAYDLKPSSYGDDEEVAARNALKALDLPEWDSIATLIEDERTASLAAFDTGDTNVAYMERPPIEPIYPAFAQHKLPSQLITARSDERVAEAGKSKWPKGWAALPRGFEPVRWESDRTRAVAISQSGAFDRGGEVGGGGYWVHLSNDAGKTWGEALYTGLSVRFPYVIAPASKLPLLTGDHLQIEVTYALLDTSSISYPPVGLRTLRKEANLWLDIPIGMLSKDSNGDGISDLVSAHLGVDGPVDEAPFMLGSDVASCKKDATDPVATVRRKVLLMLTGIDEAAIREPIDRSPDAPLLSGITRVSTGEKWPLFVKGRPADLACMPPLPMPVLVYGGKGEEALQRRSPDFRLIELPALVMNREKSRGYAIWSTGWTGGTILFWLDGNEWHFEAISSWIT
ncbi:MULTISPECIES: hypothetical protein [Novosphingobium]|uniref:hypothetical protein n=1 Tax=Novosphingobium TaxID=165696 RepID=UPI0022F26503|nr:hypothetical protein [Novosphingobium resinovorum]